MQINSVENKDASLDTSGLNVLCGDVMNLIYKPLDPFNDSVCGFLCKLSQDLLHDRDAKNYPDIVTFAFFCRKANITKLKQSYASKIRNRVGRGLIFHIAPSNVPINFAYTLVFALLAGNACIVKASSKDFAQTRIVCAALDRVLEQFKELKPYINVVSYGRDRQEYTEFFSGICNVRVIWGGDLTIETVRKANIGPRAFDITFSDRYSLALINADAVNRIAGENEKVMALAQDFYNDTYLYDQNACSSPRMIYWMGDKQAVVKAQKTFWDAVYSNIKDRYPIEGETAVNKQMALSRTAIEIPGSIEEDAPDNKIVRVRIPNLVEKLPDLRCAGGFFQEYCDGDLDALATIVDEKYQTITYFGVNPEMVEDFVISNGLHGIDRIVPIGKGADLTLTWDGYDLIETMSRIIGVA